MILINVFLNSLKLPNKKAMFALNRIGMDIVMIYLFILVFIVSLPAFFDQLTSSSIFVGELDFILTVIYFFMFYYLPMTIAVLLILSLLAIFGVLLAKILQRKLRYSTMWKLMAFTITIPFLLYTVIAFIYPIPDSYLLFSVIYTFSLLFMMILKFPKRRVQAKNK